MKLSYKTKELRGGYFDFDIITSKSNMLDVIRFLNIQGINFKDFSKVKIGDICGSIITNNLKGGVGNSETDLLTSNSNMLDVILFLKSQGIISLKDYSKVRISDICGSIIDITKKKKKQVKSNMKEPHQHVDIPFLQYQNNSCYIDSSFIALLHSKSVWVERNILKRNCDIIYKHYPTLKTISKKIQNEMNGIISGQINNSSQIRRLFKDYDKEVYKIHKYKISNVEWLKTQQDPYDVFIYLTKIFKIQDDIKISIKGKTILQTFIFPIINVCDKKKATLNDFFPIYSHDNISYISAEYICFNITRNCYIGHKVTTPLLFPEKIKCINSNIYLNLHSIIIHNGNQTNTGHYTCVIKKDNGWYLYDDMNNTMKFISSSFNAMTKYNNMYFLKNCSILIYHI